MKQRIALKGTKKRRKQVNGKFNDVSIADKNKLKKSLQQYLPFQKLKSRLFFIQPKPVSDIVLHSFSLSSCP
jgi:hypothetical protein